MHQIYAHVPLLAATARGCRDGQGPALHDHPTSHHARHHLQGRGPHGTTRPRPSAHLSDGALHHQLPERVRPRGYKRAHPPRTTSSQAFANVFWASRATAAGSQKVSKVGTTSLGRACITVICTEYGGTHTLEVHRLRRRGVRDPEQRRWAVVPVDIEQQTVTSLVWMG